MLIKRLLNVSILLYDTIWRLINYHRQTETLSLDEIKRILIIEISGIGDIVATLPVLDVLQKKFQNISVTYVLSTLCSDLIKYDPRVNYVKVLQSQTNIKYILKFLRDIRKTRYDLVIVPNYRVLNSIIAYSSRSLWMVGYLVDRDLKMSYHKDLWIEGRGFYLQKSKYNKYEHIFNRALKVVNSIVGNQQGELELYVNKEEIDNIYHILRKHGCQMTNLKIIFHLGADWRYRRWSIKRFSELGNIIYQKYNANIILVGGNNERDLVDQFTNDIKFEPIDLVGKLTLEKSIAIIAASDLFIGADSGPMHIAAAVGSLVIALFGPNIPEKSGPWGEAIIIRKPVPCSPCDQTNCILANDIPCMERILVNDVVKAIEKILTKRN